MTTDRKRSLFTRARSYATGTSRYQSGVICTADDLLAQGWGAGYRAALRDIRKARAASRDAESEAVLLDELLAPFR